MVDAVFYNALAETALTLIASKGRDDLSFSRGTATAFDPVTDVETPGSALTQPIRCLVLPVTSAADDTFAAGTVVVASMRQIKFAAQGLSVFVPREGDTIQFEGATWTATGVTPISPAGIPIVYTAIVKRG